MEESAGRISPAPRKAERWVGVVGCWIGRHEGPEGGWDLDRQREGWACQERGENTLFSPLFHSALLVTRL